MYKVFSLKELSGAINWKQFSGGNYLGGGNYPVYNYPGAKCSGRNFTGGNCLRGCYPGCNFLGAIFMG